MYTRIIYANTSTSTHSDIIYKTERSSNDYSDSYATDKNNGDNEEESFEIEQELKHIKKLLKIVKNALILDAKLPYPEKDKNSHLKDLIKDPHVIKFFEGKTPDIGDLRDLKRALKEARKEKKNRIT